MAAKRKRKATTHKRRHSKKTATVRTHSTHARKRVSNPKRRTHKRRTHHVARRRATRRRSNPAILSGGVSGQVVNYTIASLAIGIASPLVQPLLSPLTRFAGQYSGAANIAITGVGLGWLAEKFAFTRRFGPALQILGISGAVLAVVTPLVRGLLGGSKAQGPQGRRAVGPNGIGVWVPPPGQAQWLNAAPVSVPGAAGPQGVGTWAAGYGR